MICCHCSYKHQSFKELRDHFYISFYTMVINIVDEPYLVTSSDVQTTWHIVLVKPQWLSYWIKLMCYRVIDIAYDFLVMNLHWLFHAFVVSNFTVKWQYDTKPSSHLNHIYYYYNDELYIKSIKTWIDPYNINHLEVIILINHIHKLVTYNTLILVIH